MVFFENAVYDKLKGKLRNIAKITLLKCSTSTREHLIRASSRVEHEQCRALKNAIRASRVIEQSSTRPTPIEHAYHKVYIARLLGTYTVYVKSQLSTLHDY